MVAILYPRRLRNLLDVTQPQGTGLPDQGIPVLASSNSSFVIQTHGGGGPGGSFSLGASNIGNTLGDTGVTGSRVVLAGIGNLTLSQATDANGGTISISAGTAGAGGVAISASNSLFSTGTVVLSGAGGGATVNTNGGTIQISVAAPVAQTVQTQNRFNLTLDGNTAGALAEVSSGTLTLAGGNGITLSQAGNAITISGNTFSQSVQPETQTFIGGVAGSNTTYTSGTVELTGSNMVTVRSSAGQRLVIDATQSVQPGIQNLVASNTTFSSGTVSISGFGDITVNTAANIIRISGSQSVQTQNLHNVTLSGNTAGVMAQISSGTMTLAGGNNITVSQNGNAVTISGANVGGAQTGISGIAASNTTYTSGTVTFTGVGGGITVSSNTGQRIDLSVAAQTNQTEGWYALGNTTGQSSSTTLDARTISVRGDGEVSVGYSGGSLRISAPVQTAESQSFGMSNVGNTSGTTGIASGAQMRFILAGGNNITLSQSLNGASGTITISAFNQSNQSEGWYALGNTTGQSSSTTLDARTISVRGDGIVSVGYSGGSLRISASQSVQAETQTFIGGLANSQTTYTSGTVSMSELGAITIRSTTGNQYQFSVNAQTGTQFSAGLSNLGNTAGDTGTVAGRVVLVGSNNITLSGSTNGVSETISIIGGAGGGFSAGVSNVGNTSGDTGITGTRLVLSGGQSISLSQSTNASGATVMISGASTSQSNQTEGWYALGNTTGQSSSTTLDARTISVRGDGIVSVGYSGGSLRISASQSVQTQSLFSAGVSTGGNTAGDTGVTGTRMVFVGSNNITLSQATAAAGGTITISGPTTAAQTNQSMGWYALGNTTAQSSSTTMDARTISVRGDGIVSVGYSGGSLRISATEVPQTNQTLGMYAVQNTTGQSSSTTMDARTLSVAGDGAVSVGYSAGSLRISAPVQTGTQFSAGLTNAGNTAGDTGTVAGRVVLVGSNNITLSGSTNGVSQTISVFGGAGGAGFSGGISGGNTSGDTGATGTRVVFAGGNNITLSGSTNANGGSVTVSAPNASVISAVAPLSTSTNGSTISILGPAQFSGGFSTQGNTAGDTGYVTARLNLVGSNNITLSGSTNGGSQTISIIGGAGGGFSAGVSNIGNTAGDTGITGTRLVLSGGQSISLSQSTNASGATVMISGASTSQSNQTEGWYAVNNTTAQSSSTTLDARTISVAGDGAVSVGYSAGSLRISAPPVTALAGVSGISLSTNGSTISIMQTSGGPGYVESWFPASVGPLTYGQQGQGTLHMQPMPIPQDVRMDRVMLPVVVSNATNSSFSISISQYMGIYTRNASTLSLLTSQSTSTNFSGSGTAGSYSLYGGSRWQTMALTTTLSSGDYWMGIIMRTTTGGGAGHSVSQVLRTQFSNATFSGWSGVLGVSTAASNQFQKGLGTFTATTAGLPTAVPFASLTGTGTLVVQVPVYALMSGTV